MKKTVFFLAAAGLLVTAQVQANADSSVVEASTEMTYNGRLSTFCMAVVKGDIKTVEAMIERGARVNEQSNGMTPLHYAARYNRPEIAKLLIENGASLEIKSSNGMTAAQVAEASNASDVLTVLNQYAN